jgi:hypothetical protein
MDTRQPYGSGRSWRKSSHSGREEECLMVSLGRTVLVRDSLFRHSPVLEFPAHAWVAFTRAARRAEL